jgi:hypothetical protein
MRAMLCVGLTRDGRTIAPRLLTERGEVVVAEALPGRYERMTTLGQRVTYLAGFRKAGLYDCEVCDDGTLLASDKASAASPQAAALLAAKGWKTPQP